jgi:hypothetical protein
MTDRAALEAAWLELTRRALPALAAERGWPVRADHCFQRILLDNAVGGVWYDAIAQRPAYRHASDAVLADAVALGRAAVAGSADLPALNARSLAWRRQAKASASRSSVAVSRA